MSASHSGRRDRSAVARAARYAPLARAAKAPRCSTSIIAMASGQRPYLAQFSKSGHFPGLFHNSGSGRDGEWKATSSAPRRAPARKAGRDRSSAAGHTEPHRHYRRCLRKQGPQACRPGAGEAQTAPNGHAGPQCIAHDLLVICVSSASLSLALVLPLCPVSCCGLGPRRTCMRAHTSCVLVHRACVHACMCARERRCTQHAHTYTHGHAHAHHIYIGVCERECVCVCVCVCVLCVCVVFVSTSSRKSLTTSQQQKKRSLKLE
jgi:hypothetical protein